MALLWTSWRYKDILLNILHNYIYRVMVMSDGLVVEYENPQVLLKKQDSLFYAMAKDAGLV